MSGNILSSELPLRSISSVLEDFASDVAGKSVVRVADVMEALHERGFGVVLLFFALPMALPIPVPPVINVILALPLLFLTVQQMVGRHTLWLPDFVLRKTMNGSDLASLLSKACGFLRRFEALTRPRLQFATGALGQKITGALGIVMALCVMIPLPLTNTVPSFGIALMAIGVLMRDGVAVVVGALIGTIWVAILVWAFVTFGAEGIDVVKDAIKSML